jgi:hypothetical protein
VTLKVLWPYVPLKVRGDGGLVLREFYAGAPVPENADPDDVARLVRKGALVDENSPAAAQAVPAGTPVAGEPPNVPVKENPPSLSERLEAKPDRPAGNASQASWLDYAVANRPSGMSEEDAIDTYGSKTRAELVAEFGG